MAFVCSYPKEEIAMWKFAMWDRTGYGTPSMWEQFKLNTGSTLSAEELHGRFVGKMLPILRSTKFHVDTKLRFCQLWKLEVSEGYLEELTRHARVQLDENRRVKSFQIKKSFSKNRDMYLTDEEIEDVLPILRKAFSPQEDAAIWEYVLKNAEKYSVATDFWKDLHDSLDTGRAISSLHERFTRHLVHTLSQQKQFSIQDKLKLYKCCRIPITRRRQKKLEKNAEVIVNEDGVITSYKMKEDEASAKRDHSAEGSQSKKARIEEEEWGEDDGRDIEVKPEPEVGNEEQEYDDEDQNQGQLFDTWPHDEAYSEEVLRALLKPLVDVPKSVNRRKRNFDGKLDANVALDPAPEAGNASGIEPNGLIRKDQSGHEVPEEPEVEQLAHSDEHVSEQRGVNPSGMMVEMFEMMQRMEERNKKQAEAMEKMSSAVAAIETQNQKEGLKKEISEMKQSLLEMTASTKLMVESMQSMKDQNKKQVEKMKELEERNKQQGEDMEQMRRSMTAIQTEMAVIRQNSTPEVSTASAKKEILLVLKKMVSLIETPENGSIGQDQRV